jgi:hypothetical protein
VRGAVDRRGREGRRIEAVGHVDAARGVDAEQPLDAGDLRGRQHDHALRALRPNAHARDPGAS